MNGIPPLPAASAMSRREFLKAAGMAGSAGLVAGCTDLLSPRAADCDPGRQVRVTGIVRSRAVGVGSVPVTDGSQVVLTEPDGTYELVTSSARSHVYLSVPDGYAIPRDPSGVARFHQPLAGCSAWDGDELRMSFDLVPLEWSAEDHQLLLLADPQVADRSDLRRLRSGIVPELVAHARAREGQETFAVTCGDLVYDRLDLFRSYEEAMRPVGIPFLQAVGNHDLTLSGASDAGAKSGFTRRYGPAYYSFDRGAVHYVVLDNVYRDRSGYRGYVPEEQLRWLAADLALVEPGRTVVVCQHIPMLGTRHRRQGRQTPSPTLSVQNRDQLAALLEPFNAHVLTGHVHETDHAVGSGFQEHHNGAVCGAWWTGPICADGTPKGYAVYEARGEELRWQYKATGLSADVQMWLYPPGADPRSPGACVANVWFWDPSWVVRWYEDGQPRGTMAQRRGYDPRAEALYGGDRHPERHPWINPFPTDHLFYAEPSVDASEITVEATDRFGQVFTTTLRLDDEPRTPCPPSPCGPPDHCDRTEGPRDCDLHPDASRL